MHTPWQPEASDRYVHVVFYADQGGKCNPDVRVMSNAERSAQAFQKAQAQDAYHGRSPVRFWPARTAQAAGGSGAGARTRSGCHPSHVDCGDGQPGAQNTAHVQCISNVESAHSQSAPSRYEALCKGLERLCVSACLLHMLCAGRRAGGTPTHLSHSSHVQVCGSSCNVSQLQQPVTFAILRPEPQTGKTYFGHVALCVSLRGAKR